MCVWSQVTGNYTQFKEMWSLIIVFRLLLGTYRNLTFLEKINHVDCYNFEVRFEKFNGLKGSFPVGFMEFPVFKELGN